MKAHKLLILAIIALILPLSGCDDSGLIFTRDEIVGDINTGKQIPIDNHIIIGQGVIKVNVDNSKGHVTAKSSDLDIAEVEVYQYQNRHPELTITLKKHGEVVIVVTDEKGKVGNLYITVHPTGLLPE